MDGNQTNSSSNGTGHGAGPPGSPFTDVENLMVRIGLVLISVLAITGNGLVIYFVATRRRLRTKTNAMVVSLAVSDLIVGLFLIPSFYACLYVKCDNQLTKLFYDVFLFTSVLNLCCITTDRYLGVTRPLKYHMKMTRKTVSVMIFLSWAIPAAVQLLPATWYYTDTSMERVKLNDKIFYTIQVVVFMFIPCLIMLVAYAVIFSIARKQARHLRHVVNNLNLASSGAREMTRTSTTEARATLKVFGTVLLMFVFCWILSAFRSIVVNYDLLVLDPHFVITSRMLLVSNSAINPIIYAFWKKDVKTEIKKILKMTHSIQTSSGTLHTSQDFTNGGLTRKPSNVGSNLSLTSRTLPNRRSVTDPVVNVAMADNAITEMNEEEADKTEQEKEKTTTTAPNSNEGVDNLAADVDGMV